MSRTTSTTRRRPTVSVRDCQHPRANHQHGTYLAYQKDRCRCDPCRRAGSRGLKLIAHRTRTGTHSYVDAARARQHVEQLLTVLTITQIAERSGVGPQSVYVLLGLAKDRQPSKRIMRRNEAALLAVRADRFGAEARGLVDATGTRRRLQALVAIGWPANHLRLRMGWSSRTAYVILRTSAPTVTARVRHQMAALYDELSLTVPSPSRYVTRARNLARSRGWAVPLAWDDDTIDDPDARPHVGIRRGTAIEHVIEDYHDTWAHHGGDIQQAADRLGMQRNHLDKTLSRARQQGIQIRQPLGRTA